MSTAVTTLLELLPLLVRVLEAALRAKDPKEALVKAAAAAEMEALEKARGAIVRGRR